MPSPVGCAQRDGEKSATVDETWHHWTGHLLKMGCSIVVIQKPNGTARLYAGFATRLKAAVAEFRYSHPVLENIFAKLNESKYFAKLDIAELIRESFWLLNGNSILPSIHIRVCISITVYHLNWKQHLRYTTADVYDATWYSLNISLSRQRNHNRDQKGIFSR